MLIGDSFDPAMGAVAALCGDGQAAGASDGQWVLQGEAAARTGFSVSAIRKWRRMGLVAERKVGAGGDVPRVEVRLEDVLARAALQPDRRPPAAGAEVAPAPGSLVIGIEDLEVLFERMVRAERRAEVAEAELQSLQVQTRYTLGQLAELRRQLAAYAAPSANGTAVSPPRPVAAPPTPSPARQPSPVLVTSTPPSVVDEIDRVIRTRTGTGAVRAVPPTAPWTATEAEPDISDVERLADRLRRLYACLDEYRREAAITPAQERQRQRHLAEYDQALLSLCAGLGMETGLDPGGPVDVGARAALTRALARQGIDVRAAGEPRPRGAARQPRP